MTLLTGLMILAATLLVVGLAVLGTIAAVAEVLPPRSAAQRQNRIPTRIGMKSQ
jgi:hypothetical protein